MYIVSCKINLLYLQNEALLSYSVGKLNWYIYEGNTQHGALVKTVLSRASAHPPISPLLWFLEVLRVTAHHAIFFSSHFVRKRSEGARGRMVRASENVFVKCRSNGRGGGG